MEHSTLEELLDTLEKNRKIHICVVFQGNYESALLARSAGHRVHNAPVCKYIMKKRGGYQDCYRCRSTVGRMVTRSKKPVSGYCPSGVYEYCSPVIYRDKVVAVIYIGNILLGTEDQKLRIEKEVDPKLFPTMDRDYTVEDCGRAAGIVASYITLLLDAYGISESGLDPLVERVKHYILENYAFGFSASDLADAFGYNEKYLGRMFKKRSGQSIKEYCNTLRVNEAKKLLMTTDLPVSEIAGLTGFNNITYFNYVFSNVTGMSPGAYRASDKNS